jgi:hypothetical protein
MFETNRVNAHSNQMKRLENKKKQALKPSERSKPGHLLEIKANNSNKTKRIGLNKLKLNVSIYI